MSKLLCLAVTALVLAGLSANVHAQNGNTPATLLDYAWTVNLCMPIMPHAKCVQTQSMQDGDSFTLERINGNWLNFKFSKTNGPTYEFKAIIKDSGGGSSGQEAFIRAEFLDYGDGSTNPSVKELELSLVKVDGSINDSQCTAHLTQLSNGRFSQNEKERLCQNNSLVHWRISTLVPPKSESQKGEHDTDGDDGRYHTTAPPNDGQGTGSGGDD